jgi:hypothetical protein
VLAPRPDPDEVDEERGVMMEAACRGGGKEANLGERKFLYFF